MRLSNDQPTRVSTLKLQCNGEHAWLNVLPGQIVEDVSFDDVGNLCSALTSVVNVEGDDGHRARERDETDGHAVVQA